MKDGRAGYLEGNLARVKVEVEVQARLQQRQRCGSRPCCAGCTQPDKASGRDCAGARSRRKLGQAAQVNMGGRRKQAVEDAQCRIAQPAANPSPRR
ncbi:hypothetical protein ACTMU2_38945 [Cupriavidus basilensis]